MLTLRRSESTDCVMSLYLGTSAKSLSYVGCKQQGMPLVLKKDIIPSGTICETCSWTQACQSQECD